MLLGRCFRRLRKSTRPPTEYGGHPRRKMMDRLHRTSPLERIYRALLRIHTLGRWGHSSGWLSSCSLWWAKRRGRLLRCHCSAQNTFTYSTSLHTTHKRTYIGCIHKRKEYNARYIIFLHVNTKRSQNGSAAPRTSRWRAYKNGWGPRGSRSFFPQQSCSNQNTSRVCLQTFTL